MTTPPNRPDDADKPNDQNISSVDTTQAGSPNKSPKAPHERDEDVGSTASAPDPVVKQGAEDLKRGLQDTSRAKEADSTYQKQK